MQLIINGKAAGDEGLRDAVSKIREMGHQLDVRVTWESGDAARYAAEAVHNGLDVIIAAGGDGTVNEVVEGVLSTEEPARCALAVIPFGTANDFATGCKIPPGDPLAALKLAANGKSVPIDVGQANDRYFINVASGGFGAEVTANTPPGMKQILGGAAYSIMGLIKAAQMKPYRCRIMLPDRKMHECNMLIMAVGNGRQCGGGQEVAPRALLNDGLLDMMILHDVTFQSFGTVLDELFQLGDESNDHVSYAQVPSLRIEGEEPLHLNLDGEPIRESSIEFRVLPEAIRFILPADAPLQEA